MDWIEVPGRIREYAASKAIRPQALPGGERNGSGGRAGGKATSRSLTISMRIINRLELERHRALGTLPPPYAGVAVDGPAPERRPPMRPAREQPRTGSGNHREHREHRACDSLTAQLQRGTAEGRSRGDSIVDACPLCGSLWPLWLNATRADPSSSTGRPAIISEDQRRLVFQRRGNGSLHESALIEAPIFLPAVFTATA